MVTQKRSGPGRARASSKAGGAREAKTAIRREQVLAAARGLFCEHGYAATSTRRIADAAGVTEGLLFHYFPTKEALLLEIASRQHSFAGHVLTLVQQAGERSARELLGAMAQGLAGVSTEEAAFIGFMHAEALVNPTLRTQLVAATEVVLEGLVQALQRRVAAGELRQGASLGAAMHGFFGGFLFFFSQHRHLGEIAWRREAAAFATAWADTCWRGLAAPESLSDHSTKPRSTKPRSTKPTSTKPTSTKPRSTKRRTKT